MNQISYSLSDDDIRNYLDDQIKVIPYSDIQRYTNTRHGIYQLLEPFGRIVILYKTNGDGFQSSGHWCCLFRNRQRHEIEFFDSYGMLPDDQLEQGDELKNFAGQNHYYLTRLLADASEKIIYNHFKLQRYAPNINTCGRWCLLRLLNGDLSLEEFKKLLDANKSKGISYDQLVTKLISF